MNKDEFVEAQERAVKHLSRFYNIRKIELPKESPDHNSCYQLELEILKGGNTLCLVINIILEPDFPLSLPIIFLSKEDIAKLGFLPNIDTKGQICTFDRNTNIPNPNAPEQVLEVCVKRAKNIIEDGLQGNNLDKFNNEFIAYWENTYEAEENVDLTVLSLIGEKEKSIDIINYVEFQPSIGMFGKLIYSEKA
ncbi:MAG: hypothetical protein HND47_24815 [Chloroflexi bacterium]|nr:hypothetical protein [Chloroflexota bacterium]